MLRPAVSLLVLILLCPISLLTQAQAQETEPGDQSESLVYVPFVCNVGDRYDYEVTEWKFSKGNVKSRKTELLKLKVLSAGEEEVVIAMQFVAQLDAAELKKVESDPLAKALFDTWTELVVQVVISPSGVFQEIKNIEDVEKAAEQSRMAVRKIIDDMKKGLTSDSKMKPEDLEKIYAMVVKNAGSTESVVQKVITPLNLILQFVDTELDINKQLIEETEVDFGVGDVPATEIYTVKDFDEKKGNAVFEFRQIVQGEEAGKKFMQVMNQQLDEVQPNRKKETPEITVLTDSTLTAKMDLKIGWPVSATWIKKFNNLKDDQLEMRSKIAVQKVDVSE